MANLPAQGYISNAARTEGEIKQALDTGGTGGLRDVLAQMIGGGSAEESLTISGNTITPTTGQVKVAAEAGTADFLDTINTTNLPDGSVLIIRPDTGDTITVRDTGNIVLLVGTPPTTIVLGASLDRIVLILYGSTWYELHTFFDSLTDRRALLGLGDSAVMDQGTGNGLDADTVDGQEASAFLGVAATAADSDKVDGLHAASFARIDIATLQTFIGNVGIEKVLNINDLTTSAPQIIFRPAELPGPALTMRTRLYFETSNDSIVLQLFEDDGSTLLLEFRLRKGQTAPEFRLDGGAGGKSWEKVWTEEDAGPPTDYSPVRLEGSQSGTLSASQTGYIELPENTFVPCGYTETIAAFRGYMAWTIATSRESADPINETGMDPRLYYYEASGYPCEYKLIWRYIPEWP